MPLRGLAPHLKLQSARTIQQFQKKSKSPHSRYTIFANKKAISNPHGSKTDSCPMAKTATEKRSNGTDLPDVLCILWTA